MKYYVYELADPDTGEAFYVGKGTGKRMHAHEREAAEGVSSYKCNKIRKIVNSGKKIIKRKIGLFADEQRAYEFEALKIAEYNEKLTNIVGVDRKSPRVEFDPFLSDDYMRCIAIGLKLTSGNKPIPNRPWAGALARAFIERFDEFFDNARKRLSDDQIIEGVRRHGVDLKLCPQGSS